MIAIDPGAGGGIAWREISGIVHAVKMPTGMTAQCDFLRDMSFSPFGCAIEKVGTYMPGNSGPAAATFARHCGHLEAALYCLGIPVVETPLPRAWMSSLPLPPRPVTKGIDGKAKRTALTAHKRLRKNAIKELMARRHPHLKVTLATADALAILGWAEDKRKGAE